MKLVYVIGNGLDKRLGLATSYNEFYEYYLSQQTHSQLVEDLKNHLSRERYTTWADLEEGLGFYTKQIPSVAALEEIVHDISSNLKNYLLKVEDSFNPEYQLSSRFLTELVQPWGALLPGAAREVGRRVAGDANREIDIISLNYTFSIEKMVSRVHDRGNYPYELVRNCYLRSIKHIHQSLGDDEVIIGVNDESQIINEELRSEECYQLLVKPYINQQLQHLIDEESFQLINNADVICIFGASLGNTDLVWWRAIGERVAHSNAIVLYFAYDGDVVIHNNDKIKKQTSYTKLLTSQCGLEERDGVFDGQLFIGYKRPLFEVI